MKSVIDAFLFRIQERRRLAHVRAAADDHSGAKWHDRIAEALEDEAVEVFTEIAPDSFDEDEFRAAANQHRP